MSQSDRGNDFPEESVVLREQTEFPAPIGEISGSKGVRKTKGAFEAEDENGGMMTLDTDSGPAADQVLHEDTF
ncbi:MAG: hypothetical protein JO076_15195 [Verrucomicrobia bacterium]|nr:hypothetical protein [Verrucomicrobiota bacterium]